MSRQVTLFINSLRGGGAERVCTTLANELTARGWHVELLTLNLRNAILAHELDPAVQLTELGVRHARHCLPALARYLRARRPTDILVFNYQLAILLVLLRRAGCGRFRVISRNISTLSLKRDLEPSIWHGWIVHALTHMLYRYVDLVVAQSQGMKRDLIDHYGIDAARIVVIRNPLPERFLAELGEPLVPMSERADELLYVGRLVPVKGLELLIEAFAICVRDHPELQLRLLGEGNQREELERLIRSRLIDDRIVFEGYVRDPLPFYRRARVAVLSSLYEGFPNVIIEAMSQGTPVVSIDCTSGPAEIIVEGVNGILVARRDPQVFAEAIQLALESDWDPALIRHTVTGCSGREIGRRYEALLVAA